MVYTTWLKVYEEKVFNLKLYIQVQLGASFLSVAAFNEAHWLFAYNYWVLSWRIDLIRKRMSPDIYYCRFTTVNILMSLIILLLPAVDWVLQANQKAFVIVAMSVNLCLALSCAFLVWGFVRMIKTVQSYNDHVVKKAMIFWYIVAYLFIFTA